MASSTCRLVALFALFATSTARVSVGRWALQAPDGISYGWVQVPREMPASYKGHVAFTDTFKVQFHPNNGTVSLKLAIEAEYATVHNWHYRPLNLKAHVPRTPDVPNGCQGFDQQWVNISFHDGCTIPVLRYRGDLHFADVDLPRPLNSRLEMSGFIGREGYDFIFLDAARPRFEKWMPDGYVIKSEPRSLQCPKNFELWGGHRVYSLTFKAQPHACDFYFEVPKDYKLLAPLNEIPTL